MLDHSWPSLDSCLNATYVRFPSPIGQNLLGLMSSFFHVCIQLDSVSEFVFSAVRLTHID